MKMLSAFDLLNPPQVFKKLSQYLTHKFDFSASRSASAYQIMVKNIRQENNITEAMATMITRLVGKP